MTGRGTYLMPPPARGANVDLSHLMFALLRLHEVRVNHAETATARAQKPNSLASTLSPQVCSWFRLTSATTAAYRAGLYHVAL